jgi:lysozyme family protein
MNRVVTNEKARTAALWVVDEDEGVDSNHPNDRGGRTRYGVTEAVARRFGLDVRTLTLDDAIWVCCQPDYWQWDWVAGSKIDRKLLDIAYNAGLGTAVRILQRAINLVGVMQVEVDGRCGSITRAACNQMVVQGKQDRLLAAIAYYQMDHYRTLAQNDDSQRAFIGGWMVRALKV